MHQCCEMKTSITIKKKGLSAVKNEYLCKCLLFPYKYQD